MARIINSDSICAPLWFCCCCGGLPFLGLIQGLLVFIPVTLFLTLGTTLIAIIFWPQDVLFTFITLYHTPKLGTNLKVVSFFLVIVPLILWPVMVSLAFLVLGLGFGLFYPVYKVFDESACLLESLIKIWPETYQLLKSFWKYNSESYFEYLEKYRNYELAEGEEPLEIHIDSIFGGLLLVLISMLVDGLIISLLAIVKFIPILFATYWKFFDMYFSADSIWICTCFIPFMVANLLILVISPICLTMVIVGSFLLGFRTGYIALTEGFAKGAHAIWDSILAFDTMTNRYIFGTEFTIFCCAKDSSEETQTVRISPREEI